MNQLEIVREIDGTRDSKKAPFDYVLILFSAKSSRSIENGTGRKITQFRPFSDKFWSSVRYPIKKEQNTHRERFKCLIAGQFSMISNVKVYRRLESRKTHATDQFWTFFDYNSGFEGILFFSKRQANSSLVAT